MDDALLFRRIATLDLDVEVGTVDDWKWAGPTDGFAEMAAALDAPDLLPYARRLAAQV